MKKVKAIAMFSGGLDSILAVKLMLQQGIDIEALTFTSPFYLIEGKGGSLTDTAADMLGVPLRKVAMDEGYLEVIRNPKHGYGKLMNPCIDCRIYTLRKAKEYAANVGAHFIFTGEVLGERPMSQRRQALDLIEREAGLEGIILRPLSAKLLPETEPERKGVVDRSKLLDIKGRSRKRQIELAEQLGISNYPCPSGGCLLTYKEYAGKIKDLFQHEDKVGFKDIELLKVGRHFRFGENKIIVGRDEEESKRLASLKRGDDYFFEALGCGSPVTLLQGPKNGDAVETAASVTARYSDCNSTLVKVRYEGKGERETIRVEPLTNEQIKDIRIIWRKA